MNADIWSACGGSAVFTPLTGTLFRLVVTDKAALATNRLVASLDEQVILEGLLETGKPPLPKPASKLHYLLKNPFRYPPLSHGSRFGRHHEPSLFYGSLSIATVLAESAYYRLVFWQGMATPPKKPIIAQHTLFNAGYACDQGVRLQRPPFDAWQAALTHRSDYTATQALGTAMRQAGVMAFEYVSARDANGGLNVALFSPTAFTQPNPGMRQDWISETTTEKTSFYCYDDASIQRFTREIFVVNGVLPMPAA